MSFKREVLNVLREISTSLARIETAIIVQGDDVRHRLEILETEAPRVERRLVDVERKIAAR